ncbi:MULTISPECIES: hypothetical protein [unclassified Gluconobacter]|uniref:hypothetical protein n=1 Tax=unclassified Gluconobacter TaxID=2644261 RepID=UPI001C04954D|nr:MULTISPECIES: hypothetical protein [unclassified Gluconobacter]
MKKALLTASALLFATAAYAAPSHTAEPKAPVAVKADPLAGLTMDQQMELCERLETLKTQNKPLAPKMQQQLKACQAMSMDAPADSAPDATQDR